MTRRNNSRPPRTQRGASPLSSTTISRRAALQRLGVGAVALTAGCAGAAADGSAPEGVSAGADPSTTREALSRPLSPLDSPLASIDSIVVLMMENRSFDHFLGSLKLDASYPGRADIDGLTGSESNPDPAGMPVPVHKLLTYTPADPPHDWTDAHAQWDSGKNDGFVRAHAGASQADVMGYHDRSQLPFLYSLADRYTVCDRWFASVMGPTFPNRYYLHACTSRGRKDNSVWLDAGPPTIWQRLKDKGVAAKNYAAGIVAFYTGGFLGDLLKLNPVVPFDHFLADAKAGTLPPFSLIDPDFMVADDHPSHNIQLGQAFMATIMAAVSKSPQWSRTMLVITYDEHGGFFDHVSPPTTKDDYPDFQQLGFRTCSLVIGPTVRAGHVESTQYDHTSVAATLRTRFGIDTMGTRMEAASDLSACIDPMRIASPAPPPTDLPKIRMRWSDALRFSGVHSQPVLEEMIRSGAIPPQFVDQRSDIERTMSWLRAGQELGALILE